MKVMHSPCETWVWGLAGPAQRGLKRLRKEVKLLQELNRVLENELTLNPFRGEQKHGDLEGVWGWHVRWPGSIFCIAYTINPEECFIRILLIGPHEGFYDELKRCISRR